MITPIIGLPRWNAAGRTADLDMAAGPDDASDVLVGDERAGMRGRRLSERQLSKRSRGRLAGHERQEPPHSSAAVTSAQFVTVATFWRRS